MLINKKIVQEHFITGGRNVAHTYPALRGLDTSTCAINDNYGKSSLRTHKCFLNLETVLINLQLI